MTESIHHSVIIGPLYDALMGARLRNATYRSSVRAAEGVEITDQTASRDLRGLVEEELLVAHGERRDRTYTRGAALAGIDMFVRELGRAPINDPFGDPA